MKNKQLLLLPFLLFTIVTGLFFGCESEIEELDDAYLGYDYYPLEIGNEWTYKLDSFLYSNDGIYKDTASWYVKEKITQKHGVGSDDGAFVIERSKSADNMNWEISDIWTIKKTETNIQKTEENHTFIKLVFPPTINKRWDGNAFIDAKDTVSVFGERFEMFGNWSYKVLKNLQDTIIEGKEYLDVLKVKEVVDTISTIDHKESYAYYSRGVGLVLEERSILFNQPTGADSLLTWPEKANIGFILRRALLSHKLN